MWRAIPVCLLGITLSGVANAERHVHSTGDFESGRIQSKSSTHDGFWTHTLPIVQSGSTSVRTPDSDFGPGSGLDTRVVTSEVVGGETITPRNGNYFLRAAIYADKNYLELNAGSQYDKPRSKFLLSDPAHRVAPDVEGYVGFSIYVPLNYEHELGVRDHRGQAILFAINPSASRTHVTLGQYVQSPATEAHWYLMYNTSATSVDEDGAESTVVDLGPVNPDLGKWTDFVIRFRFNPFSVATNPFKAGILNSIDQLFEGNKGILQVWKAEGAVDQNRNRKMVLKVDRVNMPIGLVPRATDNELKLITEVYKYGWLRNPTTLTRPVWYGFDEIRQGQVLRDGTGYADVNPAGTACATACGSDDARPEPPIARVE